MLFLDNEANGILLQKGIWPELFLPTAPDDWELLPPKIEKDEPFLWSLTILGTGVTA